MNDYMILWLELEKLCEDHGMQLLVDGPSVQEQMKVFLKRILSRNFNPPRDDESLRDRFAAAALTGLLTDSVYDANIPQAAEDAYGYADAMLEARNS